MPEPFATPPRTWRSAEHELSEARRAVEHLPERSALDHLRRTIDDYQQTAAMITALRHQERAIAEQADRVRDRLNDRKSERDAARFALDALRTKSGPPT